ncbi:hypothetical protein P3G55_26580, partial [Leptospira sp. 96542]|nr:hypothetical protein [Leptospira sp. 96542]
MTEIKANEVSLAKSAASQAIASATGLPAELVSAGVNDFVSARDAKKARRAISNNPLADGVTKVVGVVGGLVKTVFVAAGVTGDEFQSTIAQANQMTGGASSSAGLASLGLAEQMFGLSATGTSFSGELLNAKDKDRLMEELTKRALAEQMAKASGVDFSIAKGFIDKGYADHKTRESNRKAQGAAIEQVAVMVATTAITMGAG